MDGVTADLPKCFMPSVNEIDEVLKNADKETKKARRRAKIDFFVKRFYNELYP